MKTKTKIIHPAFAVFAFACFTFLSGLSAASAATVNVTVGAPGHPPPAGFRVQLRAFVGNDPSWRSGEVDLGFERAQHNVIFPGACGHRQNMGFWNS